MLADQSTSSQQQKHILSFPESLHCSPETITALLINYIPLQKKKKLKKKEYTSFPSAHGKLDKVSNIFSFKTVLNRFIRAEIIQSIYSKQNRIELEINRAKIPEKSPNI